MLNITLNSEQFSALEGLAYWVADASYMRERFGNDEPELERVRKTIDLCFSQLDRLSVPFWVQNSVVCWAENWRNTKRQYFSDFLKNKSIFLQQEI